MSVCLSVGLSQQDNSLRLELPAVVRFLETKDRRMISLTNLTCILPETQPLLELFLAGGGRILRLVWASLASGTDGARRSDGMPAEWKLRQTHLAALLLLAELSAYSQVGLFLQQQDAVRRCFPTMDRRTSY